MRHAMGWSFFSEINGCRVWSKHWHILWPRAVFTCTTSPHGLPWAQCWLEMNFWWPLAIQGGVFELAATYLSLHLGPSHTDARADWSRARTKRQSGRVLHFFDSVMAHFSPTLHSAAFMFESCWHYHSIDLPSELSDKRTKLKTRRSCIEILFSAFRPRTNTRYQPLNVLFTRTTSKDWRNKRRHWKPATT